MYLILTPCDPDRYHEAEDRFTLEATSNMLRAASHLEKGCLVYKLDNLTKLEAINISYEEVTQETADE